MNLDAPITDLSGVGEKSAAVLNKYGIKTLKDFFYNLPRDYENYQFATSIRDLKPGKVVVKGKIENLTSRRARRRNMTIVEGDIRDKTGAVKVVWFNQFYREKQFQPEKEYFFSGNFELKNGRYSLISPATAEAAEIDPSSPLRPLYVAHGAFTSEKFRKLMEKARDRLSEIPDLLPTVKPGTRKESLFLAHFPRSEKEIQSARQYLAYEELFSLILAAKLNQQENQKLKAVSIPFQLDKVKELLAKLPFELTKAQKKAAWEIFQDLEKEQPMNRLLQGDVGSGKTLVAALAIYMVAMSDTKNASTNPANALANPANALANPTNSPDLANSANPTDSTTNAQAIKAQSALLAPTAILATQHFDKLSKLLEPMGVKIALLTGATKKKAELKKRIQSGEIDLIVGTHALLTDDTEFRNLALVIIDEQHRFGVSQRQKLLLKSPKDKAPHLLSMTATPIPRSLQLTVFGDLDVSILDELPAGRQPIRTEILREIDIREKLYPKIAETLDTKQQIYWVCPAVEEDSRTETTSVKTRAAKLKRDFPKAKIEFLHGRMKPDEKDEIMARFSRGKIEILVSTTVIEVGVDVPNATLMVIENAENYGLAQLHQLRGRVGRGQKASSCFLLTSGEMNPSRRLRELEKSNDGFYLAEVDLKLRGPGEIYGVLQHGALDLKIASFADTKLIARARADVEKFLSRPENLLQYKELMNGIRSYQQITTLN